jgi:hypothetical protein
MSAMGWRTDEPVEAGPEEAPTVLTAAVDALRQSQGSTQRLAAQVGVPHGRLCRMIAVPEEREQQPEARVLKMPVAQ